MCTVSDKIKLCSCVTANVQRDEFDPSYKSNQNTILNRLSEAGAFDKEFEFKNKDVLEIVLNNHSEIDRKTYCFQFKNGTSKKSKFYPFELEREYDERDKGKIKNPIKL